MQKNEIRVTKGRQFEHFEAKVDRQSEHIKQKAHLLLESIHCFGRALCSEVCFLTTGLQALCRRAVRVCIVLFEWRWR